MEFKFILLEPVFGFRFILGGLLSVFVTANFFLGMYFIMFVCLEN
jgi:hypothetical protein